MRRRLSTMLLATAALLGGCASVMRVDNEVQSFPQWPAGAPQRGDRFAFERLPSQQSAAPSPGQDGLELAVRDALVGWGMQLPVGQASVRWLVQVKAGGQRLPRAPWDPDPWDRAQWRISGGIGFGGRHGGIALGFPLLNLEHPYYFREIAVVLRDAASGRVVYETRARHDGRWNDSPALWNAMVQGAMRDFPTPPAGVRQVNIDIPR
ncbi:DUF4136 domain-containing protein [Hydrogenophaga sp. OTU3427]|uniref:DUF4136 domain-containing protein n=1 Tax=Hydrogenophaga sp. OTU3427 TaxID=3043856 RepID=UPI00313BEEA4